MPAVFREVQILVMVPIFLLLLSVCQIHEELMMGRQHPATN